MAKQSKAKTQTVQDKVKRLFDTHPKKEVIYKVGTTYWWEAKRADVHAASSPKLKVEVIKKSELNKLK